MSKEEALMFWINVLVCRCQFHHLVKVERDLHRNGVQAVVVVKAISSPGGDWVLHVSRLELVQEKIHPPAVQLLLCILYVLHELEVFETRVHLVIKVLVPTEKLHLAPK